MILIRLKKWIWNILIAIDQLINAILWGDPDETLSSRMGKMLRKGTAGPVEKAICEGLEGFEKDHCKVSIEEDEGKDEVS